MTVIMHVSRFMIKPEISCNKRDINHQQWRSRKLPFQFNFQDLALLISFSFSFLAHFRVSPYLFFFILIYTYIYNATTIFEL